MLSILYLLSDSLQKSTSSPGFIITHRITNFFTSFIIIAYSVPALSIGVFTSSELIRIFAKMKQLLLSYIQMGLIINLISFLKYFYNYN